MGCHTFSCSSSSSPAELAPLPACAQSAEFAAAAVFGVTVPQLVLLRGTAALEIQGPCVSVFSFSLGVNSCFRIHEFRCHASCLTFLLVAAQLYRLAASSDAGISLSAHYLSMACCCREEGSHFPKNRDRIMLRGMLFHGYHGVYEEENKLGQKFLVDVDAWMDLTRAGETDDMDQSVSYADMYKQIKTIVEGPPFKLVEAVASAIARTLLTAHPMISDVRVKVCKPHVAVEGIVDHLGVEIFRSSEGNKS